MTKITVIMPVYREKKEHVMLAIESIINQTYKDFEYVIILDDPNNKELEELIREYESRDSRISLYINERNLGCPRSKDRGIRLAQTEYVAIMDSDDVARPNRLEMQLKKMESEKLDMVAGYVTVVDEDGTPLYDMDNLPLTHEKIAEKLRVNNCMPHPTWFLRKEMYMNLGGYADIQGCEDYDFLIRAVRAGYRLGMVDDIVLDYRLSTHSISRNNLYKQYLMMRYLQDKYFKKSWNECSCDEFIKARYTEKKAEKYARASMHFESALAAKAQKKLLFMLVCILKTVLTSGEYALKIFRYVLQEM